MTNANLAGMLRVLDAELAGALEKSRASFQHRGSQGTGAESAFRSLLDSHLPRYLTVGTGEIIDQADTRSGQIDVVISNEDQPFRNGLHDPGVFLAEGISAAGEIKSRLTTQRLDEAINSATQFRRLRSRDVNALYSDRGSDDKRFHQSRPFFLFAFENTIAIPTLLNRIETANRVQAPDGTGEPLSPLDAVFILGQGAAINYHDGKGVLRYNDENGEVVAGWRWHPTSDSVIIHFLLWLNSVMPRFVKLSPITPEYLFRLVNTKET
jgi:hypothetical protein